MPDDFPAPEAPTPLNETAATIVECAARLFADKGFTSTSIREIAAAAGVTKPTLYYHFGSKEGLITHILNASVGEFKEAIDGCDDDTPLGTALYDITLRQLVFAREHPAIVALVARIDTQPPAEIAGYDLPAARERCHLGLEAMFARSIARGEIVPRDPRLYAVSFLGALVIQLMAGMQRPDLFPCPPEETAADLVDLFLNGALPRAADAARDLPSAPGKEPT